MRNNLVIFMFLLVLTPLSGVHDFTVNGGESAVVSIGDSIHFEFEFESVGNSADFELSIELLGQNIPLFSGNYLIFQDGGMLDETGLDGSFTGGINNFIQLPEGTTLVIMLSDEEVSDYVTIQFEQLDTDFSIAGSVLQEGGWIDFPVMGALVWTVYNGSMEYLIELFENFDLEEFLEFISSDHYLLSDITGLLGSYQVFIPEDIPDVACTVGVFSALDMNGEYIAPAAQEVIVNGHLSGINFFYAEPDGIFSGLVLNEAGEPVTDAGIMMENPGSMIPNFFMVDETGAFSIALANGTYEYSVAALGYAAYLDSVVIADEDVYLEIVLEETGSEPDAEFYGFVRNESGEPVINAQIMLLPIEPAGEPQYIYSMADGSFGIMLTNGTYSYLVSHAWYIGAAGEFQIADEDVYLEIVLEPVNDTDEDLASVYNLRSFPNPFNPVLNISFYLTCPQQTNLSIYNVKGELVETLACSLLEAGAHSFRWYGMDSEQNKVSSGVYYYRLQTGSREETGKVLLLK